MDPEESNIGRRDFLQMAGVGIVAASAGATATQSLASNPSADSESSAALCLSRRRNSLRSLRQPISWSKP